MPPLKMRLDDSEILRLNQPSVKSLVVGAVVRHPPHVDRVGENVPHTGEADGTAGS